MGRWSNARRAEEAAKAAKAAESAVKNAPTEAVEPQGEEATPPVRPDVAEKRMADRNPRNQAMEELVASRQKPEEAPEAVEPAPAPAATPQAPAPATPAAEPTQPEPAVFHASPVSVNGSNVVESAAPPTGMLVASTKRVSQ